MACKIEHQTRNPTRLSFCMFCAPSGHTFHPHMHASIGCCLPPATLLHTIVPLFGVASQHVFRHESMRANRPTTTIYGICQPTQEARANGADRIARARASSHFFYYGHIIGHMIARPAKMRSERSVWAQPPDTFTSRAQNIGTVFVLSGSCVRTLYIRI